MDLVKTPLKLNIKEVEFHSRIMRRLLDAKMNRDKKHPELSGMTYLEYYQNNEKIANSLMARKEYDDGLVINSGTVESKLYTVASEINRLNLSPEVKVFDKDDRELVELSTALTDTIFKTEVLDEDEETKLLRQVELLKQGNVFVQELWSKEYKTKKEYSGEIGKIANAVVEANKELCYEGPRRRVLYAPGVYLGNIREINPKKQPYIFTHRVTSYSEAKSRYGGKDKDGKDIWDRWKNVPTTRVQSLNVDNQTTLNVNDGFALSDLQTDMVEEIHYQDTFNNDYQIYLNGIPMLPAEFPLSAISPKGEYNITYQILQYINGQFAIGRSFVAKTSTMADLLDELLRLLILKTRKSIHPPYANNTGRVISPKSLMPGRITMGINATDLQAIGQEGQGPTASEYQMYKLMNDAIDNVTVSPQMQGQIGPSGTTAYEVSVAKQQAQRALALILFAMSMMEKKVAKLRLDNIMVNYFNPIDTKFDETRNKIVQKFRSVSRNVNLEGRGAGRRDVITVENKEMVPSEEDIYNEEEYEGTPEPMGMGRRLTRTELGLSPLKKIYLSYEELRNFDATMFIEIDSRPKDTTNVNKLLFKEMMNDIIGLINLGSTPNVAALEDEFADVWGKKKEKVFQSGTLNPAMNPADMMAAGANTETAQKGRDNLMGMSNIPMTE